MSTHVVRVVTLRITPELYRLARLGAALKDQTMNAYIGELIEKDIKGIRIEYPTATTEE